MSDTPRTGRDWLRAVETALSVVLGLSVVAALFVLAGVVQRGSVSVPVKAAATGAEHAPPGTALSARAMVEVELASASWSQAALDALTMVPTLVVVITALILLLRVVRQARSGDPFTAVTVRRLRRLGVFLLVGGMLSDVLEFVAANLLAGTLEPDSASVAYRLTPVWILTGLGLLAVAEVVNRGCAMRAELDQVV